MLPANDEERIHKNDRVLAVIPNQYIFYQVLWYHSQYPEGIWDALIPPYGIGELGTSVQEKISVACKNTGIFSRVICNDALRVGDSLIRKIGQFFNYLAQNVTNTREKHDHQLIGQIMGYTAYKKVLMHPCNMLGTAALNSTIFENPRAVLILLEDGLADYGPEVGFWQISSLRDLLCRMLQRMNVVNLNVSRYPMKYDGFCIKYSSLPDRMQYRNYKKIKPLFQGAIPAAVQSQTSEREKYDLIVFTAPLKEDFYFSQYSLIHEWLKRQYSGKRILVKVHPRDHFPYAWEDLCLTVLRETALSGEEILDMYSYADVLFFFTSTILIKMCRERRPFQILRFSDIKNTSYRRQMKQHSEFLGIDKLSFVDLSEKIASSGNA